MKNFKILGYKYEPDLKKVENSENLGQYLRLKMVALYEGNEIDLRFNLSLNDEYDANAFDKIDEVIAKRSELELPEGVTIVLKKGKYEGQEWSYYTFDGGSIIRILIENGYINPREKKKFNPREHLNQ